MLFSLMPRFSLCTTIPNRKLRKNGLMSGIKPMTHLQLAAAVKKSGGKSPQMNDIAELSDLLILLRHGERLDHVDRACKGSDPPLSTAGRQQSFETALHFLSCQHDKMVENRLKGMLSLLMSSPFHRCLETAIIVNVVGFGGGLPIFVNPLLCDWLQTKVFRSPPVLRGHYYYDEETMDIYYSMDSSILVEEVVSFLESASADEALLSRNGVSKAVAQQWGDQLKKWCENNPRLPLWTSATTYEKLYESIFSFGAASTETPTQRGKKQKLAREQEITATASFNLCGISYPERRKDLLDRSQEFIDSQFLRNDAIKPWDYYVPVAVVEAARKERKNHLPSSFKTIDEISDRRSQQPFSTSLLPPMHILCCTHADTISSIVESSSPKQRLNRGASVPYCSMTILKRRNNFYHLCLGSPKNSARHISPSSHTDAGKSYDTPSLEWEALEVGSLKALETRIILQYH